MMQYVTDLPTIAGFYWHRAQELKPSVCEVFEDHGRWYAAFPIGRGEYDWIALEGDQDLPSGSEWAGPIPEPN